MSENRDINLNVDTLLLVAFAWQVTLIAMKLANKIDWSWFLVFLPCEIMLVAIALFIVAIGLWFTINMIAVFRSWISETDREEEQESLANPAKEEEVGE